MTARFVGWAVLVWATCGGATLMGQDVHYFHRADHPPGSVGWGQLQRGGPLPGYFQPVEIQAPPGVKVSLVADGRFDEPQPAPRQAGMLIGQVYRLKVTGIPFREGMEVFPTIELVNRLYPPEGKTTRFPVPIQLDIGDIELALSGKFVTRVIYLEDPQAALAVADEKGQQRFFEVGSNQDPLKVADQLGRPMAILRMGSRVPQIDGTTGRFMFYSPPWTRIRTTSQADATARRNPVERFGRNVPRQPDAGSPRLPRTVAEQKEWVRR